MSLLEWVLLVTAVLCGVAGGVFFAFSTYVMPALDRAAPAQAVAAWRRYAGPWTRGNHVRALAGVLAAGLFIAALRLV
ncbi:MAG: hypothetical protein ACJ76K_12255 [Solirubrobacteraceae bacterium]